MAVQIADPQQVTPNSSGEPLRIALLMPRGPLYRHRGGIWKRSLRYAPLTLTTLASLIPDEINAEVTLVDEGIGDIDLELNADLIGISAITGTAPRAYELADHFRQRGVPVVLGGVHPTLMPEEAAGHADSVVVGYAEDSWPELLHDFVGGHMRDRYDQAPSLSLADRPLPRRDLLPSARFAQVHTIEATRGCIHRCEFCVVPAAWGRPIQYPVERIIADIKQMAPKRLIFLDLNLIADRNYAIELFTALIPLGITWGGLATTLLADDDELLDLIARSGCRGLLIGFESVNRRTLVNIRKAFNTRLSVTEVMRRMHERNIAVMGCFVFGFDADTVETFDEVTEVAIDANIDLPRYAIQTPFPATALYHRLKREGRILTEDWTLYDGQHVVFQPHNMTPEELLRGTERAWKQTYSWRSIARRLSRARNMPLLSLSANLGYRYYAHRLNQYYTCDWFMRSPAGGARAA